MRVIKVGGRIVADPEQVAAVGRAVAASGAATLIVHGGGTVVDEVQRRLGVPIEKVDGLRRTDAETREVALMVLCGLANKQFVAGLHSTGVPAVGLCGIDGGLLRCRPLAHPQVELGYVGEIERVDPSVLESLFVDDFVPVVAPLSLGLDGEIYNVNADQAAAKLALALGADSLDLVSDVAGVVLEGTLLPELAASEFDGLRRRGAIHGGMVPKVEAGLLAARGGVGRVRVTDIEGLSSDAGTVLVVGERAHSQVKKDEEAS